MDFISLILYAVVLLYIGGMIYLANLIDIPQTVAAANSPYGLSEIATQQRSTFLRWMLYGLIGMHLVIAFLVLQFGMLQNMTASLEEFDVEIPPVDQTAALIYFGINVVLSIFLFRVVASLSTRQRVKRVVGERSLYNPDSTVHTTAIVLSIIIVSLTLGLFVLSGGISGLAEDVESEGVSLSVLLFQNVLMIAVAFLGIGLAIRRTLSQSLERLGLRIPTVGDVVYGLGAGFLLYGVLIVLALVWEAVVPADQIREQSAAAEQIARAFNTIPLAFMLSLAAALGEEILFRGALQPVFGLFWTSIVFVLFHSQYTLTPATLIIFVVALGLGLLRQRQSTTAAIIAHFTYNFVQLALAIFATQYLGGSV
jgi:uncharacterized protein